LYDLTDNLICAIVVFNNNEEIIMDELKVLQEIKEFLYWFDYSYDPIGGSSERAKDWLDYLDRNIEVSLEKLNS